jgi:hypothetical protein
MMLGLKSKLTDCYSSGDNGGWTAPVTGGSVRGRGTVGEKSLERAWWDAPQPLEVDRTVATVFYDVATHPSHPKTDHEVPVF